MDLIRGFVENTERRRCQSLNSLLGDGTAIEDVTAFKADDHTFSDSSGELCMHSDSDERAMDSGICDRMIDSDMLAVMEQKIDRLSGEYQKQFLFYLFITLNTNNCLHIT